MIIPEGFILGGGLHFFKFEPHLQLRIHFAELCMLQLYIFESINEETQEADEESLRCEFPRFTQP